jgi:hypothetical protein
MVLPTVKVEVDCKTFTRPHVIRILSCTEKGIVTCTQPQLWLGEILVERVGQIPMIVKEAAMAGEHDTYRHQMVRAVIGTEPAIPAKESDPVALDSLCRQLVDAQAFKALLRANGCNRYTDSLAAMVRTLLDGREAKRA